MQSSDHHLCPNLNGAILRDAEVVRHVTRGSRQGDEDVVLRSGKPEWAEARSNRRDKKTEIFFTNLFLTV